MSGIPPSARPANHIKLLSQLYLAPGSNFLVTWPSPLQGNPTDTLFSSSMRLLNTDSITLAEFYDERIPEYVILSHFWEREEVLYKDIIDGTAQSRAGFSKLEGCCRQAKQDGFNWVWIDTCCIDKTSSSELSEAINSMFKWYKSATICYAYLADVTFNAAEKLTTSRWFTRGWTLQELIAPAMVEFYSREWINMGTKSSLQTSISVRTGIKSHILLGGQLSSCNIAEKMSWATERKTSRVEDTAYCLLGIFNVNIPMLYGEGENAFVRLQQEILSREVDYSIFAWSYPLYRGQASILASNPRHFSRLSPVPERSNFLSIPSVPDPPTQNSGLSETYSATRIEDYSRLRPIPHGFVESLTGGYTPDPPMMTSRGLRLHVLVKELHSNVRLVCLDLQYKGKYICIVESNQLRNDAKFVFSCDAGELSKFKYKTLYFDIKGTIRERSSRLSPVLASVRCVRFQYRHSLGDYTAKLLAVSTQYGQWVEPQTDSVLYPDNHCSVFCIVLFRFIHKGATSHPESLDSPNQDRVVAVVVGQKHVPLCIIHEGSVSVEKLRKLFEFYSGNPVLEVAAERAEKLSIDQAKESAIDRDACYINSNTVASATVRRISGNDGHHSISHSLSIATHQIGQCPAWVRSSLEWKTRPES